MKNVIEPQRATARAPSLFEIFFGPFANWIRRRSQSRRTARARNVAHANRPRAARFESLEPRLLLSADLSYSAGAGVLDATLRFVDDEGPQLQLIDRETFAELASTSLSGGDPVSVSITGGTGEDRLFIDFSGFDGVAPVSISLAFDDGMDSLFITGGEFAAVTYRAFASDAGRIELAFDASITHSVDYVGVEAIDDLTAAHDRTFANETEAAQQLRLSHDGLINGRYTVDSNDSDAFAPVRLADPAGSLTLRAGDYGDTFILGEVHPALAVPVLLEGGAGADTLAGPAFGTVWTISGADAGELAAQATGAQLAQFTGIENLRGADDIEDSFIVGTLGGVSGVIDGGAGGFDELIIHGAAGTVVVVPDDSGSASFDGRTMLYAGLEAFLDASDPSAISINATVLGDDLVLEAVPGDPASSQVRSLGYDFLIGGVTSNTYQFANPATSLTLNLRTGDDVLMLAELDDAFDALIVVMGGPGIDTLTGPDASSVWHIAGEGAGTLNDTIAFAGFENLAGGAHDDVFTMGLAGSLSGTLSGGAGYDELRGPAQANAWLVTGVDAGELLDAGTDQLRVRFTEVENLVGADNTADEFVIGSGASLSGTLDGGVGGGDSLVIQGDSIAARVVPDATSSGTATVDGTTVTYAGIEGPVEEHAPGELVLQGTFLSDNLVLEAVTGDPGQMRLRSADPNLLFFVLNDFSDSVTFANPTQSLTVDLKGGSDTLTINGFATGIGTSLFVKGGGGSDAVIIAENALVSTRAIAGTDHMDGLSTGDSGEIHIEAETIEVRAGAKLLAHAIAGISSPDPAAGDITLIAEDTPLSIPTPFVDIVNTESSITLDSATVRGAAVTLQSSALADKSWDDFSPVFDVIIDFLDTLSELGGVAIANSNATVSLTGSTEIDAGSVFLGSKATAEAEVRAVGVALSVAYGSSNPFAEVTIGGDVDITTSGDLTIESNAESRVNVQAKQSLLGPNKPATAFDTTLAIGLATLSSNAWVQQGATLNVGGNLELTAKQLKEHAVSSAAGAYEDGAVGVAFAISASGSAVNALLDGNASVGGNVTVSAQSDTASDTSAVAQVGTGIVSGLGIAAKDKVGLANATGSFFQQISPPTDQRGQGPTKFALSAAVAWADHENLSMARIGAGSVVSSDGADGVQVESRVKDDPEISGRAFVDSQKISENNPAGNTKENSASTVVVVGNYANTSHAYIGQAARVDASHGVAVDSETSIPLVIDWLQFAIPQGTSSDDLGDFATELASDISATANSNFGLQNGIFTSWAQANASGTKTALGFSVDVVNIDNSSHAWIAEGALVNQDVARRSGDQNVTVQATNLVEAVHLAGVFGLKFLGTSGGEGGVGGSYLEVDYGGAVTAQIHSGARVFADALLVRADSKTHNFSIAEAGGSATDLGINGAFSLVRENNRTLARIDDGAFIETGTGTLEIPRLIRDRFTPDTFGVLPFLGADPLVEDVLLALDSNGDGKLDENDDDIVSIDPGDDADSIRDDIYITNLNLLVVAEDESSLINIGGGVTKGQSIGVGFSVSINEIDRTTEALIGNRQQAFSSADVNGDNDTIAFDGPHGYVTGEEFVYDPGEGTAVAPAGTYYAIVIDPRTIKLAASLEDAYADEPVAVDLTAPGSDGETQFLRSGVDAAGSIDAQGRGKITAVNQGSISAWSVAGSLVTSGSTPDPEGQEAPKKSGKYGFGLSLSTSFNAIDDVTRAYVESAQLEGFTDLGIVARDTSNIFAVAGSVAISTSQTGIGAAGAWAQNVIRTDTAAYVSDSSIGLSGDLRMVAENTGKILGISASLSGAGKAGVAGSVSINRIDADARAYIADGSSVEIPALTFDPAVALPDASGTIQLGYAHGLSDGARVVYRNGGGESIGGLINGETYYVDVVDDTAVQLARSATEARADPETYFDPASDVNVVKMQSTLPPFDEIEVAVAGALFLGYRHGFRAGDAVVYRAGGGTSVGGLVDGQTYYVVRVDDRAVMLAATREDALAGEAMQSLDPTAATGTEHSLRLAIDAQPAQGGAHFLAAAGNVELSASNDSIVHSVAAAPAFGGKGGIGASVAVNTIRADTEAYIADSDVDAFNDIAIRAESGNEIAGVSAAIGAATGPIAAAVSVSVNTITDKTGAWIDGRLSEGVRAGGDIAVEADAASTIFSLAGSLAGSTSGTGVGVSTAVNVVNNSVEAAITGDAIVDSTSGDVRVHADQAPATPQSGFAVSALDALELPLASTISSGAIGGGVASSLGLAGSVSVNVVTNESRAHIGERRGDAHPGQVTRVSAAGDVSIGATDDAVISTAAGNIGGGGTGGVGIASTTIVTSNVLEAYIGVNAEVDAAARGDRSTAEGRGVSVVASSSEDIRTAAVAGAGGGTAGGAGSATVTVLNETTRAFVDRGARLNLAGGGSALQDVLVRASDDTALFGLAGALAGGGSAGIGAGADVPVITKETEARIGAAAQVAANGNVEVKASSTEDIVSISGAIGGGGSAGIAGTASVPVLDITTRAFIGPDRGESTAALSDTLITFDSGILLTDSIRRSQGSWLEDGFAPGQSITVSGTNRNDGVYGIADISADGRTLTLDSDVDFEVVPGADIQIAQNVAQGDTGAELSSDGHIGFSGNGTDPDTITRAKGSWSDDGFAAGQLIEVSGSGLNDGIYRVAGISDDGLTMTLDGDAALVDESVPHASLDVALVPTTVRAEGNVIVAAEAHTELDLIAGNVTGAGAASVGAAATVPVVNKETQAFIGRDAVVDAKANRAANETLSGDFAISYEDPAFSIDNVPAPLFFVDGALSADLNFDGTNDLTDPSFTQQRISTPETAETKGVSISAVNRDDIESLAISGGGSGTVAVNIGGSVNVVSTDTAAFVDRGARINSDAAGAGSEQSVRVAAGNDFYHMGMALVAGGSGTVAVTPGADVTVVNHRTHAYIANETEVNARQDVVVSANALDDILSVSAGVAGSGLVSVGGAVSVITVDSSTHAHIGEEFGSADRGALVRAGGNILISANDSTDIDVVAGSAGVGIGAVGVGASVAVTVVDKDTRAFVGDHAVLDALAGADGRDDVLDGGLTDAGASTETDFRGLAVQAQSAESVFSLAATVGGGFYAGVGGAVTVEVIHSDTTAFIGEGARINADAEAANSDQSVNVSAFNEALVFAFAGGVGAGIAGIGGGVDVGVLRNNTSAYIGNGAEVQARRDVDVNALSLKDVDSVAASAGVGLVGGVGSVTVWAIGTRTDATYSDGDTSANALETSGDGSSEAPQYGTVQDFVDAMAGGGDPGNPSGGDNNGYTALLGGHARSAFDPSIAVNDSQDSIDLGANHGFATGDAVVYRSGGGGGIGGLVDGGTYYVIATDDPGEVQLAATQNDALDGVAIDLDASVASGDRHELVSQLGDAVGRADDEVGQSAPGDPASGAIGETEVTSGTTAFVGENARVQAGDDISIRAHEVIDFDAIAGSVAAGVGGIGGSVVVANLRSNTDAHVAGGSILTAGADVDDELLISAHLDESASARAYAGQVGAVTIGAQVAVINDSSVQQAYVEDGAVIAGANSVRISATANITVSAHAIGGGVGGAALGAAVALASIDGTTQAFIDGAVVGRASGDAPAAPPTVGSVDVTAESAASADALAIAVAAGLGVGINASVATANVDPEVKAYIGTDADVAVLYDIDIGADAQMQSTADALGVAVGATGGLGVSVAAAMLAPVVTAHIGQNANVTAGNDVRLRARANVADDGTPLNKGANASATSGSGGLFVGGGAGAFADVTVLPTVESHVASGSTVNAGQDVTVQSAASSMTPTRNIPNPLDPSKQIELAGAQASGAGFGSIGVGVSVAGTEIGGSVIAYVDDAAIGAGRDVRIGAESSAQGSAGAQAVSGGIVGGAGNGASVSISPTVSGYIGAGADVAAGNDVAVTARSQADAEAEARGVSVGLGVSIGVSIVRTEIAPTVATYIGAGATVEAGGDVILRSLHNVDEDGNALEKGARATGAASGGGALAGNGVDADAIADAMVRSYAASTGSGIDAGYAEIDAGGDVTIQAMSANDAVSNANGLTVGLVGIGVILGEARSDGITEAYLGAGTLLTAGANLLLESRAHSMSHVSAVASGGGLASGQGAHAAASASPSGSAYVGSGARVQAGQDARIAMRATNSATANTGGGSFGGLAIGASLADANIGGSAQARVDAGADVLAGRDVSIATHSDDNARATATATSGGVLGGAGADSDADVTRQVAAIAGTGTQLSGGQDVEISARALVRSGAEATGTTAGGIGVGLSSATATEDVTVNTTLAGDVAAGRNASVEALYNIDEAGAGVQDALGARATGSAGSLVAGILLGADALATSEVSVTTLVAGGSLINAADDLVVVSGAYNSAEVDAIGNAAGLISVGSGSATSAMADMDTAASTVIGSGAVLDAGRNQMVASGAVTVVSALATGSSGQNFGSAFENLLTNGLSGFFSGDNLPSIFSNGGTVAQVTVANTATTDVRAGARLEAGNGLGVSASAEVIVDARSTMSGASAFVADAVAVTDVFIDSDAVVLLGDGAFLVADHVEISAHNRIDAVANAYAKVTADIAKGTVTAIAGLNVGTGADPSEARVNLGAANITGRESVLIEALNSQGSAPLVARAIGEAFGGITSTSSALADGSAEVRARVDSSPGMVLTTAELVVRSDSTFVLQRDPIATADTVVTRLVEQIRTIQREVEQRVCRLLPWPLNLVCRVVTKVITETIINVVEVADFSSEFTQRTGSGLDARESINLNGDIFNFGAGNLQLVIDEDGSVNPVSNIGAVIDGDNIVVNPILSGGTANILFDTPQGTIGGNAVLHLSKVIEDVSVVNHSDLNLVFGTVELVAGSGVADIETAPDVDYISANAFEFEIDTEIVDSRFDVRNNGTGNILFTDSVENVSAKFSIVNEGGDILVQDDSVQFEVGSGSNPGEDDNIVLSAAAGSIGSADNPFNLRLVRGLQLPDGSPNDAPLLVAATAGEDIHLEVVGVVNTFEPFDPADRVEGIRFDLDAGRDVVVTVARSEVLDIDLVVHAGHTHAHGGESHSHAVEGTYDFRNVSALTGDAVLTVAAGDLNVGLVHAGASAILSASRSIFDADDDAASDVNALHVVLNAGAHIGAADNALEIDSAPGGSVNATAKHDIHLDEIAGDLHAVHADSTMGSVNLAAAGAIVGAGIDPVSDVTGVAVRLAAGAGIDLRVDSKGGLVDAIAQQDIYLRETAGDLRLGLVASAGGDARLEAAGSILDGQGGAGNNVEAANIWLAAEAGGIGAGDNAVEIDSAGLVTASGLHSIFLAETAGDLVVGLVSSSLGAVHLTAAAAIRDGDEDSSIDISGTAAVLIAGTGIGEPGNALETTIGTLEADAGSGGVWLVNSGALEVGDVTAAGDVSIVALSPITVTGAIVGADVFLEAADTPGPGDDLTVQSGASITAIAGDVTLIAGDALTVQGGATITTIDGDVTLIAGEDLVVEAGSVVTAEGAVSISAGGNLLLSGTILADSLSLEGNDDDNVFVITTLATDTTVRTYGGNDTVHVGSNATFVSNTGGNVNAINATLVIDAGNGSGFDTLTVDDSGDAADNSGVLTASSITGLGMTGGRIDYSGIEDLSITLGSGDDTFTILSTHAGDTAVDAGAGSDTVNVGAGSLNAIDGALSIAGGSSDDNDTLNIDDTADTAGKTGTLTATSLTGLGMAVGIEYSGIEVLNIGLGSGADSFVIESTHFGTTTLNTNDGADTVDVRSISGATTVMGGRGNDTINVGSLAPAAGGNVRSISAPLTIDGGDGSDTLNVDATGDTDSSTGVLTGATLTGLGMSHGIVYGGLETLNIGLGSGGDIFTIAGTHTGQTTLNTNDGADLINVLGIAGATQVFGGEGGNTFNVGGVAPSTGGLVDGIVGRLTLLGGSGIDKLIVDDSGDQTGKIGTLSGTEITGLGMGAGIGYEMLEDVTIHLGSGDDTLTIESTHLGTTTVNAGAGADVVNVQAINGTTTVNAGAGNDTINVGSLAPMAGGNVNAINAPLVIHGDEGDDTLNVDDTGDVQANVGTLDGATLTGLGMSHGITYNVDRLNIALGSGADVFNVRGTSAVTNLALNDGDDRIYVSSEASADLLNHAEIDFLPGNLDGIQGALNIDAGAGRHQLMVSDESATTGDTDVVITDVRPLDPNLSATAEIWITGLAPAGISFEASRPDGNFYDGISIWTGSGDDTVRIDGTHERPGARTTTMLHTGLGDDHVTVSLDAGEDGAFHLHVGGGDDTVDGSASTLPLVIFGGAGDDDLTGGSGGDVIFGDYGVVEYHDELSNVLALVYSVAPEVGGNDTLRGIGGDDVLIGGSGDDWMFGGAGDDMMLGDNARITFDAAGRVQTVETIARTIGGVDTMFGEDGEDVLIGGAAGDRIDGGAGDDLIFGDNVRLERKDDYLNPRFRALQGTQLYSTATATAGDVLVTPEWQLQPGGAPVWGNFEITVLDHSHADEQAGLNNFGDDYIAGGTGSDMIFGQLGDDIIQGDGSIDSYVYHGIKVNAWRDEEGDLWVNPSFEHADDGDDYIEGGGGRDVIFGGLGQDDIIGGSSSLFNLQTPEQRPDGGDMIFGGAGTRIERNEFVGSGFGTVDDDHLAALIDPNRIGISLEDRHARDSDMILGDNGNIYRIVGTNGVSSGGYLAFNYDAPDPDRGDLRIIPRAAELLDYTPGGPDFDPVALENDIGSGDEIHGESGDDFIYGMTGNDVIFGGSEDDDIIGGWGHDWISGGSGQDGILGDDGRIFTSRNGVAEPLNGIAAIPASQLNQTISTPGNWHVAVINVGGALKKAVDLTPYNPVADGHELSRPQYADDIIFGGLGDDFIHGGAGDDAISGAEALPMYFERPFNPGNILRYSPLTGEFAEYDEYDPWREVVYNEDVTFTDADGNVVYVLRQGAPFILNFDPTEGPLDRRWESQGWAGVPTDGDDVIFGGLGNDWIVGGTGRDHMYGGWGDDLINADDDHRTNGGANDGPDTHPGYEDIVFGGAGRDVMIANTGGDRLIDWAGEFNSYIVPFAPFGLGTVTRSPSPGIMNFLYALSESDGADFTRAADTGADPARNGEPYGELGLVRQQDFAWRDQTGAPADPQPGNIAGGKRDVIRSASFDNGSTVTGFSADSGVWAVENGALQVAAESRGGDAVSVLDVGNVVPAYFEVQATVKVIRPTAGWEANAFIIFDYNNEHDFKFAGIDQSNNKLVIGHRDASGWHIDKQSNMRTWADRDYNLMVAVNGLNATLVVDNKVAFTHTFEPRVIDGWSYGLNWGLIGLGSDNSRGAFDNFRVQTVEQAVTFQTSEDFNDGEADLFTGDSVGVWDVANGRYATTPGAGAAYSLLDLGVDQLSVAALLDMNAKVQTDARAGFIFDEYSADNFKFAAIDANSDEVIIGHYTKRDGWVVDASVSKVIDPGEDYKLGVVLKGTTVSVTLDEQTVLGHAFNAVSVDGGFGLLATGGQASFDDLNLRTTDTAFAKLSSSNMIAAGEALAPLEIDTGISQAELDAIAAAAISQWTAALGDGHERLGMLGDVRIDTFGLAGQALGYTEGKTITIDTDAAGHGWFIDVSPADNAEFSIRIDRNVVTAATGSDAFGRMDLLTVMMHEIGHVLGFGDNEPGYAVMDEYLEAGARYLLDAPRSDANSGVPISDGTLLQLAVRAAELEATQARFTALRTPGFEPNAVPGANVAAVIDWQSRSEANWAMRLSPFDTAKVKGMAPSFAAFELKPVDESEEFEKEEHHLEGFDSLSVTLRGAPLAGDDTGEFGNKAKNAKTLR